MFHTKSERSELWRQSQILFAEVAHQYPCCDVPTLGVCYLCGITPSECKNKQEILNLLEQFKLSKTENPCCDTDSWFQREE